MPSRDPKRRAEVKRNWRKNNPEKARAADRRQYKNNLDNRRASSRAHQQRVRAAAAEPSHVYFISDGEFVKIGTSKQLAHRIKSALRWNPRELTVLKKMPGDRATEMELHARFAHLRVRGEWFRSCDELLTFIGGIP